MNIAPIRQRPAFVPPQRAQTSDRARTPPGPVDLRVAAEVLDSDTNIPTGPVLELWELKLGFGASGGLVPGPAGRWFQQCRNRTLRCLTVTGDVAWEKPVEGDYEVSPTPRPDGGLYVTREHSMQSYDRDGNLLWEKANPIQAKRWNLDLELEMQPTRYNHSAVCDQDGNCYVYDFTGLSSIGPDGTLRWHAPAAPGNANAQFDEVPVIKSDGTIVAQSGEGILHGLRPEDGSEVWRFEELAAEGRGAFASEPVEDQEGNLYFAGGDGRIYSLDPTGNKRWEYFVGGDSKYYTGPTVDDEGNIYLKTGRGGEHMMALNKEGARLWSKELGGAPICNLGKAPNRGFLATRTFSVSLFDADGNEAWEHRSPHRISEATVGPDGEILFGAGQDTIYAILPANLARERLERRVTQARPRTPPILSNPNWVQVGCIRLPVRKSPVEIDQSFEAAEPLNQVDRCAR